VNAVSLNSVFHFKPYFYNMQNMLISSFKKAVTITAIAAIIIFAAVFALGKINLFLLLNNDLGKPADIFFEYWTYMGDGLIFIPVLILFILYRKKFIPLLIAAFIVSTIITHLFKDLIIPNEPRPTRAITDITQIHTVNGVELHTLGSFPSGHTTTAFTIFLLGCLVIDKKWFLPVGFMYALLVGYSRIYLAQHFPTDIAGGMIAAILTLFCSITFQKWWENKK